MKPVIHSVSCWGYPNLRTWVPQDAADVAQEITLDIGPHGKKGADSFTLRVATPRGLSRLPSRNGIVATRPLLVMERYHFESLWAWLEDVVSRCDGDTWQDGVSKLAVYFLWEYEGMDR